MKRISKILMIGMATVSMLSASTVFAGAACTPQVKVIECFGGGCGNYQTVLNRLCGDQGCCDYQSALNQICGDRGCGSNTILKYFNGYCPDGNCSTQAPQSTEAPAWEQPAAIPPAEQNDAENSEFNAAYENEVVRLVNVQRANYGLAPLTADDGAARVAHVRAKEIVQSFSHTRPNGTSCFTAAGEAGVSYRTAGENIAYGYSSPEQVVNGWMNSEGHRKNILSSSFTKIGVGCYESGGVYYWSQFFIG